MTFNKIGLPSCALLSKRSVWHDLGVRLSITLLSASLLHGCSKDVLLQSPVANSTESVDQIKKELDEVLLPVPEPVMPPESVMAALTPELNTSFRAQVKQEPRFDIAVNSLNARAFFEGLVDGTGRNIVIHPDVQGEISIDLRDVTLEDVLDITKEMYGYDYDMSDRLVKVFSAGLRTEIFQIDYLNVRRQGGSEIRVSSGQLTSNDSSDSGSNSSNSSSSNTSGGTTIKTASDSDFWSTLEQTLQLIIGKEEGRSVVITPAAGVVVVRANAEELNAVGYYLDKAQLVMQRQVILEAKILEVELSEGYEQGIDWTFEDSVRSIAEDGLPKKFVNLSNQAASLTSPLVGGVFAANFRVGSFDAVLELLGTQGNVQVLSSPRISTVNNQKAVIKVGQDEYFVTDIEFDNDTDSNSTTTDIDLTPFFSGIALDVTPQISEDREIILHVRPTISEVQDQQKLINIGDQQLNLPLALSSVRESDSIISARDGQIVVIGGLIQSRNEDTNASVPVLGDIPLVGEIFKQKRQQMRRSELVILLRPIITDDDVFKADIQQSRKRFGELRDVLAAPPSSSY